MYNQHLVNLCKALVSDSLTKGTQVRTHFGSKESIPFVQFKSACNSANFNYESQLPNKAFNEIVYIIAKEGNVHKCHCGNPTEFISITRGYSMHCSKKCKYSDPVYIQKQKDAKAKLTEEERLAIAEKRAATNIERFGVEFTMQNKDLANKQAEAQRKKI